jgi:DNA-binding response OmpR family regulator
MANLDKKILIVEDDKDFLWILQQSFTGAGFSVVFAQDGEEGLKMAEKEKPDLILLDILMPKMDGITVAKKLKEKGIKSQIIFLSNVEDMANITEAFKMADSDYIVKSTVHIDNIVKAVKKKLKIK